MADSISFTLDKFVIKEVSIRREPNIQEEKYNLNIEPSGFLNYSSNKFILQLRMDVNDTGNSFKSSILALAQFSFTLGQSKELDDLFYLNAPSIIFPYLRAYLSSLTALSGLKAVNLPIQNLTHLKDKLKANTKVGDTQTL